MEWLDRFNEAIDYLEQHLEDDISYEQAAKIACCSVFHFQRMFAYIVGIPLSEYIRRRRMTAAAFELQTTDEKIVDLAVKYGYDSPTAFNRAFKGIHGIAPSDARREGIALAAFPRINLTISIKGDTQMNYKIVTKDAFRTVGVRLHTSMDTEKCFVEVPKFWQKNTENGMVYKVLSLMNQPPMGLLGVSACMGANDFDYYISVVTDLPIPEDNSGLEEYIVPATTWAVFECIGPMPQVMQELQKRIITEWLPTSGYEYANAPDIEIYYEGDQKAANYRSETWLPVMKKN